MQLITSVVLGVVEGVTEFLPVSSTGHLILVNQWLTFGESYTKIFDVAIQLGAILAAVVYFWDKIWPFGKQAAQQKEILTVWTKTLIGVLPVILIGGAFGSRIQARLFNPWVVAAALIAGGVIMLLVERKKVQPQLHSVAEMSWKTALLIGCIQCLSMIPGTSRSAATIIGAMLLGVARTAAVEFSFFLAIPTMSAATAYSLLKHGSRLSSSEMVLLAVGFLTAFCTALAVIRLFVSYIKNNNFTLFAYYRLVLGVSVVMYFLAMR